MPVFQWWDADEYTEYDEEGVSPDDFYVGGIGLIGGTTPGIIWDEGQDSVIYPPQPGAVRPPNGPAPTPPRVKRPKVPPPFYP